MSMKLNIACGSFCDLVKQADDAGIPHDFVEINLQRRGLVLQWRRDGSPSGFEVTLDPALNTWSVTMDFGG